MEEKNHLDRQCIASFSAASADGPMSAGEKNSINLDFLSCWGPRHGQDRQILETHLWLSRHCCAIAQLPICGVCGS